MAKRTLETGFYGSIGMGDPESSFEDVTLRVAWDFGKKPVPENKTIPLMQLPKGFMIDRISVIQTKAVNAETAVTFGLASDDAKLVGGSFTLAASGTLLRASQAAAVSAGTEVYVAETSAGSPTKKVTVGAGEGSLYVADDDILCLVLPDGITGDKLSAGAFDVCLRGYRVFAEQLTANPLKVDAYRATLQTQNNISGGQWPLD